MRYTLEEIFQQSVNDPYASSLNGVGYRSMNVYGIKSIKDNETGDVEILNTTRSGNYYVEIADSDYEIFLTHGWRYGVYELSLLNYKVKLDWIERNIKKEVNKQGRVNDKQIQLLKSERDNVLQKYTEITIKLNKLKSNGTNN
jgi:predicted nuclease of predicted toxin-antitoxin system